MAAKVVGIGMLCFIVSNFALAQSSAQSTRKEYTPVQYFKNYALSTCIAYGFRSEKTTAEEASAAAGGYLELGTLPWDAHTEAALLGRKFLAREYRSMSSEKLTLMKCIDFYHSKELDRLARKYIGKK